MAKLFERVFGTLTLLCVGGIAITGVIIGAGPLRHYADLSKGTLTYYAISLLAGVALALFLLTAPMFRLKRYMIAIGGVGAALALGVNQFVGLRLHTILCFTPS